MTKKVYQPVEQIAKTQRPINKHASALINQVHWPPYHESTQQICLKKSANKYPIVQSRPEKYGLHGNNSVQWFSSIFFWKNWTSDKNPDSTETSRVSWETRDIKNTPGKTYRLFMSLEIEPVTRFYNTEESLKCASFRWLMKFPIMRGWHLLSELCQDVLHGVAAAPLCKHSKMPCINLHRNPWRLIDLKL
jgi:hypothetical protein